MNGSIGRVGDAGGTDSDSRHAPAGYRDGKLTILELVDAYESQRDYALRRIDLAVEARAAELEVLVRAGKLPH